MQLSEALVQEFDLENRYTRRTLERVPLDKFEWKPHDKSMTLGWLSTFLALATSWVPPIIERDVFDPSAPGGPPMERKNARSLEELLQTFDRNAAAAHAAIAGATDKPLQESWTLKMRGQEVFTQPRWLVLRTYVLNHEIHHRAQLGVYLRLNGIAVPAIYNDSADEKGGMFREVAAVAAG
jgi:uncharacterized damage-inducible protein DinB